MVLPPNVRGVICRLYSEGRNSEYISDFLKKHLSYDITGRRIRLFVQLQKQPKSIARNCGRDQKIVARYLHFLYQKNSDLTASAAQRRIKEVLGESISISTIKRLRSKLGWTCKKTSYCQIISKVACKARKKWCLDRLSCSDTFKNVVFTNESSVEISSHGKLTFYRRESGIGVVPAKATKAKHPYKVHVWGGISYKGQTSICIFTGIMDSVSYQSILEKNLLPFTSEHYPGGFRLYQDNDAKHKSRSTLSWLEDHCISTIECPAYSPDLNPIENVWASLKEHLRQKVKPKNKDELVDGIKKFWTDLTPVKCRRYIDHIHKVMPAIVLNNGGPSGY